MNKINMTKYVYNKEIKDIDAFVINVKEFNFLNDCIEYIKEYNNNSAFYLDYFDNLARYNDNNFLSSIDDVYKDMDNYYIGDHIDRFFYYMSLKTFDNKEYLKDVDFLDLDFLHKLELILLKKDYKVSDYSFYIDDDFIIDNNNIYLNIVKKLKSKSLFLKLDNKLKEKEKNKTIKI